MIYDFPDESEPIRQGDIFIGLPRIDVSLEDVVLYGEEREEPANWSSLHSQREPFQIVVPVRSVAAIVAT